MSQQTKILKTRDINWTFDVIVLRY